MKFLQSWQLFAFGSAFFAGLTALFGKLGVEDLNSNYATFIRTVVILAVVALTVSARNEWQKLDTVPAASLLFLALSAIATGLSWLCYYRALQLGPVSKVAPVDKLSVAFAMMLGAVILGESMSWKVLLGGALIVGGSLLMLLP